MNFKSILLLAVTLTGTSLAASDISAYIADLDSTDYEARQAARLDLRQTLVSATGAGVRRYERELHRAITADQSFATRDWSIRMLELVGTGASVKPLAALFNDPDPRIVDLARRALTAIPAGSADAALERALLEANPAQQAGFADSLAYRGKPRARNELDDLLAEGSVAAAQALGRIGSRSSKAALLDAHATATGEFKEAVELALIDAGLTDELARRLATTGQTPAIKLGAFDQLLELEADAAAVVLNAELQDPTSPLRRPMVRMAMQSSLRRGLVDQLPTLPVTEQAVILGAIADFKFPQFEGAVLDLLGRADESIQPTVITTLGVIGSDASFAPLLELYLANERDRDVAGALARLQAPSADENLLRTAQGNDALDERVAALRLLVLRNTDGITDLLNNLGQPGHPDELREAAFRGMEVVGNPASVELLLAVILTDDPVKRQAQGSLKKLSANLAVPEYLWENFYVPALQAATSDDQRRDVLVILDGNSGPSATTYLSELILEDHPLRADALRTLQRWGYIAGGDIWMAIMTSSDSPSTEIDAARRGIVRLLSSTRVTGEDGDKVALAKAALLATDDADFQQQIVDTFDRDLEWGMKHQLQVQFEELRDDPRIAPDIDDLLDNLRFF